MRSLRFVLPFLLTLAAATTAGAQAPSPVLGISAGVEDMPDAFAPCGGTWGSVHAVAELARRTFILEARLGLQEVLVITHCALAPPPDGVGRFESPEVEEGTGALAELRARARVPVLPIQVGAGAGWLVGDEIPYGLLQVGLHTSGRLRFAIDAEPTWYRIPITRIEGEWRQGNLVRTLSEAEGHEWQRGVAFRASVRIVLR